MRLRQRLTGLGALLLLTGILVGLPALLLTVGGNPLPASVPSVDQVRGALLAPDDGTLALAGVILLGWVVWAALSLSIIVEGLYALRGMPAPALPVLALPQSGMRPVVIAALALFIATPTAVSTTPAVASTDHVAATVPTTPAAVPPAAAATSAQVAATTIPTASTTATVTAATQLEGTSSYVVRPGDTLWSIAERHLGSGHAYPSIVEANREQLTRGPDWIVPGQVLQLPVLDHAAGEQAVAPGQQVVVQPGDSLSALAAEHFGDAGRWPEIYHASTSTLQPDDRRLSDPDLIHPGWYLTIPGTVTALPEPHPIRSDSALIEVARTTGEVGTSLGTVPETHRDGRAEPQHQPVQAGRAGDTATQIGATVGLISMAETGRNPSQNGGDAAADVGGDGADVASNARGDAAGDLDEPAPAWLLEGIVGSGALLGGALFTALAARRRAQFRTRRPGCAVAPPDPGLSPVEKTIQTTGARPAQSLDYLDQVLRRMSQTCTTAGNDVPAVNAVQVAGDGLWLHLRQPADPGEPWQDGGDGQCWFLPAGTPLDQVGPAAEDAPAPLPLLVSIGEGEDGSAWLLNLEDREVTLTGQREYVEDLARYLAAEIAVNPWSAGIRLDCVGIAHEVAQMNPTRIRVADAEAVEDLAGDVVGVIDRIGQSHVPTARVRQDAEDTWPARMILLDRRAESSPATDQLRQLLAEHPGRTGAAIVVTNGAPTATALRVEATADGRIRIPAEGLNLVGVGLTADEAAGCAALLTQAQTEPDVPMPAATGDDDDPLREQFWRDWTDQAGALRTEHTTSRDSTDQEMVTVLAEDDDVYENVAATTTQDVATLAPRVEPDVAQRVLEADPTLEADLAAWWNPEARVPKLALLGPVKAKTWGKPLAERKAYLTELLVYLALHPHGVTTAQVAEAFGISETKTRGYIGRCREWLGTDPTTGQLHIPYAQDTPATRARGVNVYQVLGLLVDIDLFRRLRARAAARGGPDGVADLKQALRLVQGRPFDQLRPGGWGWLLDGDRLDQHMTCAVVDVAHLVATHDLQTGDLEGARAAAEIAFLAAPFEEIPTLDLVAVTAREGHTAEAVRLLQSEVCNRADDPDLPPGDLPARTQQILDRHGWLENRKEAV